MHNDERNRQLTASRRPVVFIGLATAFSLLGDQALYAVLPVYYGSLGLSAIEVGILLSANRWIRLWTNDLAHRIVGSNDTASRHRLLFVGSLGLGVLTTAAYGLTTSFVTLLLARLAWGLSWSFIRHLGVQAIMVERGYQRAGHTMGLYNGISRAGSVAGLLGGALLVDLAGFQAGMLWLAGFTLLSLPIGALGHPGVDRPLTAPGSGVLPRALQLGGFAVGIVGPGFVMSTLGASLSSYAVESGSGDDLAGAAILTGLLLAARYSSARCRAGAATACVPAAGAGVFRLRNGPAGGIGRLCESIGLRSLRPLCDSRRPGCRRGSHGRLAGRGLAR